MPPTKATKADPAPRVVTPPHTGAPWRIARANVKASWRFRVEFADDSAGEVHMAQVLKSQRVIGTIFQPLRRPALIAEERRELGAVTWPIGADMPPDAMYDRIGAMGHWAIES